jgi:uncharacterized membrane protein
VVTASTGAADTNGREMSWIRRQLLARYRPDMDPEKRNRGDLMIRRDALREYSRGSLWFIPTIAVFLSIILGLVLSQVDLGPNSPLVFQGTADDARSILITIAGTMVTVIALLLGLAVVALQLSSTQFSPRLLRNFLRDRPNQIVLATFVGTFCYSAAGLFEVGISGGQRVDTYPRFAVAVAIGLLFLSLALLVFFADHLAHSIQVDTIMRVVERNTLRVIRDLPDTEVPPVVPVGAACVPSRTSGYVQVVHLEELLAAAVRNRVHVRLRPRVGEHIATGTTLAWVWPTTGDTADRAVASVEPALRSAVRIGFERTLEQDPGIGMRQLVDAACKALSPAVNDPYTAIQAIHHLSVLYAAMATRQAAAGGATVARDRSSGVTIMVPSRSLAELMTLGLGLIRRYGASEPTVIQAVLRLLGTVTTCSRDEPTTFKGIEEQVRLLVSAAERAVVEPADLAPVHGEAVAVRQALEAQRVKAEGPDIGPGGDHADLDRDTGSHPIP